MTCATPYNSLYSPLSGNVQGLAGIEAEIINQAQTASFPSKSRAGTCCRHGKGCAAGQATQLADKLRGLNEANLLNSADHSRKSEKKRKEREKKKRNAHSASRKSRREGQEKQQPQYENMYFVKDGPHESTRDPFHGEPSDPFGGIEKNKKRDSDDESTSIRPRKEIYPMEVRTADSTSSPSKSRYIGAKTYKDAEDAIQKRADFVLYHRFPRECTLTELVPELKMYVCYRTCTGSYRHYRIRHKPTSRTDVPLYIVDYGDVNAPAFKSLDQLVKYYAIYGTLRKTKGGETNAEIFPYWN